MSDIELEKERDQLAKALERLADVQHELATGQRNLMNGKRLIGLQAAQQGVLLGQTPHTPPQFMGAARNVTA